MAGNALIDFMREREARERQMQLDALAREREARIAEMERAQSRRADDELGMRRAGVAAESLGMLGRISPDDPSADLIRQYMPGILQEDKTLQARTLPMEVAPGIMMQGQDLAPADTGMLVSRGTSDQRQEQNQSAGRQQERYDEREARRLEREADRRARLDDRDADRAYRVADREDDQAFDAEQRRLERAARAAEGAADRAAKSAGNGTPGATYAAERGARAIDMIDDIAGKAGVWNTGVVAQMLSGIGGTPAHNLAADLEGLGAAIAFGELTEMREASKTGGALGNVSNIELALLQNALGALRQSQSLTQFRTNLQKVRARLDRWQQLKSDLARTDGQAPARGRGAGDVNGPTAKPAGGTRVGRFEVVAE